MKSIVKILMLVLVLISFSCQQKPLNSDASEVKNDSNTKELQLSKKVNSDYLLMATLWYQKSAEMQAVYEQTYAFAKVILTQKLSLNTNSKPKAVVVDIDETVLDNSPFEAHCITANTSYTPKEWDRWVNKASAKALPGALDFLTFAQSKNVETFYISNRRIHLLDKTMQNLQQQGFPFADKKHIILRDSVSTKRYRRKKVLQDYDVLLYVGDNLTDFSEIYEDRDSLLAKNILEANKQVLGKDFLILPNPMYGEWEKPIFDNNMRISSAKKDSLRKAILDTY